MNRNIFIYQEALLVHMDDRFDKLYLQFYWTLYHKMSFQDVSMKFLQLFAEMDEDRSLLIRNRITVFFLNINYSIVTYNRLFSLLSFVVVYLVVNDRVERLGSEYPHLLPVFDWLI